VAFEAFRTQAETRAPSRRRRVTTALSIVFHAALIAVGVVYSFWHVEELSPPLLKVTFLASAPPPPPPPPPAGGGGPAKKKVALKPRVVVQPKPTDIVQPRETPKKEEPEEKPKPDEPKGEKGGVAGGVAGGTPGGTVGGTPGGRLGGVVGGTPGGTGTAMAPKYLPPNIGEGQKLSAEKPPFPASLRRPGAVYHLLAKICVTASGNVDKVTILKGADALLDDGVVRTVKTWRYRPFMANSTPAPFCYPQPFEFRTE
jgi:protein TonB